MAFKIEYRHWRSWHFIMVYNGISRWSIAQFHSVFAESRGTFVNYQGFKRHNKQMISLLKEECVTK